MPQVEIVDGFVSHHYIGATTTEIANKDPVLFMEVNGVPCGSAYVIQDYGTSKRTIFPRRVGTAIWLTAMGQVYGAALPELPGAYSTLEVKVYLGIVEE